MTLERRVSKLEEHSASREPEEVTIRYEFVGPGPDGPRPTGERAGFKLVDSVLVEEWRTEPTGETTTRRYEDGELVEERTTEATERQPEC